MLARNAGAVVDRERILREVWHTTWYGSSKTVDVHVAALAAEARRSRPDRDGARGRPPAGRVTWRLLASYLALTIVVLIALEVPLAIVYDRDERQDLTSKVQRDAFAAASLAEDALQSGRYSPALVRSVEELPGADRRPGRDRRQRRRSSPTPADRRDRNVVRTRAQRRSLAALARLDGQRHPVVGDARHVAVRGDAGRVGAARSSARFASPIRPPSSITGINRYRVALVAVALIVLGVAALIGLLLARSIARPLRRLETSPRASAAESSRRAQPRTTGRPTCGASPGSSTARPPSSRRS